MYLYFNAYIYMSQPEVIITVMNGMGMERGCGGQF